MSATPKKPTTKGGSVKPKVLEQPAPTVQPAKTKASSKKPVLDVSPDKRVNDTIIPSARVRKYLDKDGVNALITGEIKKLKDKWSSLDNAEKILKSGVEEVEEKTVVDGKEVVNRKKEKITDARRAELTKVKMSFANRAEEKKEDDLKKADLSKGKSRFSAAAPEYIACLLDMLVTQLIKFSIDNAMEAKKSMVKPKHLHDGNIAKSVPLYKLIVDLPAYKANDLEFMAAKRAVELEAKIHEATKNAEKEFKERYEVFKRTKKSKPKVATPVAPAAAQQEAQEAKTNFKHYVDQIGKNLVSELLKTNNSYENLRFADNFKTYLSDLIIDFINRVVGQVELRLQSTKAKTVDVQLIRSIIRSFAVDGVRVKAELVFEDQERFDAEALKKDKAAWKPTETQKKYKPSATLAKEKFRVVKKKVSYGDVETSWADVEKRFSELVEANKKQKTQTEQKK